MESTSSFSFSSPLDKDEGDSSIITTLTEELDLEVEAKIKRIYEKRNEVARALESFLRLYPEIPVIKKEALTVKLESTHFRTSEQVFIIGTTENSFFMSWNITEKNTVSEMVPDEMGTPRIVRNIIRLDNAGFYCGKNVIEGQPGCEHHEDEETIILAPRLEEDEENYLNDIHRDKEGVIVCNKSVHDPDLYNEEQFVMHFAGVPWLLKKLDIAGRSNVIFRNLHTGDIRRYIVHDVDFNSFFLLGGEFYYFMRKKADCYIVQCCSGKSVLHLPFFLPLGVESCRDYVVAANIRETNMLILRLPIVTTE